MLALFPRLLKTSSSPIPSVSLNFPSPLISVGANSVPASVKALFALSPSSIPKNCPLCPTFLKYCPPPPIKADTAAVLGSTLPLVNKSTPADVKPEAKALPPKVLMIPVPRAPPKNFPTRGPPNIEAAIGKIGCISFGIILLTALLIDPIMFLCISCYNSCDNLIISYSQPFYRFITSK